MQKILVIREFDNFSRILSANNYDIINLPLIKTKAIDDLSEFETKLASIESYDGIFLTSAKATEIFRAKLKTDYCGKVYVLGKRSYEILKAENIDLHFDESINTAREMMENITPEELKGKNFLFVRGEKSLRIVPEFLSKTATVDEAIVYETRNIAVEIDKINSLREQFENSEIVAVCFFSPSAAESFIEQFGAEILHQTIIATIGKTTADFFETRNLQVGFVSLKATAEDFAIELIEYLTNGKRKMENGK
jgi:uroporphyrinogen-III synthase